jgi:serine protease AprX
VSSSFARLLVAVCVSAGVLVTATEAFAQSGHARMSRDLRQQLTTGRHRDNQVILTGSDAQILRVAQRHGLEVRKWLETGAVIDVPAAAMRGVLEDVDVDQITTNQAVRSQMAVTNATIGADLVQAGQWKDTDGGGRAFTGEGVGVAIIDSGVAVMPQLAYRVAARVDFTVDGGYGLDGYGHGTHVAGIIAAKRYNGNAPGVAPGAHIVSLKVLDANGMGTADNVIEAIDFAIAHRERFNIKVINLSLGGPVLQAAADDPICQAVERAYRAGIVVVASAGNFGKTADGRPILGGITTPGISPFAVTVGALNTKGTADRGDDEVATYSSRGPTRFDHLIKPDLVAPGNKIESLAAPRSTLVREHPELVTGSGYDAKLRLSGTSMAAGVVSGAAALLFEKGPRLAIEAVRHSLQKTATSPVGGTIVSSGAGSIQVVPALSSGTAFAGGTVFCTALTCAPNEQPASSVSATSETIVWSDSFDETIVWSDSTDETIVWSDNADETIVWSDANDETIVWSDSADETIVWSDTIMWSD